MHSFELSMFRFEIFVQHFKSSLLIPTIKAVHVGASKVGVKVIDSSI